jgi:antitoxin component of MazEF toxin-antitoxin module
MPETFRAKVRNVGTSLGVLIPKEIVKNENIETGDEVEVSLFKPLPEELRKKLIEEAFGMFKKMKKGKLPKFERDRRDRF